MSSQLSCLHGQVMSAVPLRPWERLELLSDDWNL